MASNAWHASRCGRDRRHLPALGRTTAVSFELEPPRSDMSQRIATSGSYAPWLVCPGRTASGICLRFKHRDRAAYQWSPSTSPSTAGGRRSHGSAAPLRVPVRPAPAAGIVAAPCRHHAAQRPSVACTRPSGFAGSRPTRGGFKLGAGTTWLWQCRLQEAPGIPPPPIPLGPRNIGRMGNGPRAGLAFLR